MNWWAAASQYWLQQATGELVAAIAMTEPGAGSDLQAVRTRAIRHGNGYVLSGAKTFISNGQHRSGQTRAMMRRER
jgi:acyl-CoA dehydrogenase